MTSQDGVRDYATAVSATQTCPVNNRPITGLEIKFGINEIISNEVTG